jgi:hypothetical protein
MNKAMHSLEIVCGGNGDYHASGMIEIEQTYIVGASIPLQTGSCANDRAVAISAVSEAAGKYFFGSLPAGTYCLSMNAASP